MSGDDHGHAGETNWRVERYDNSWGGWRAVKADDPLTESRARVLARRLEAGSTFKYRAREVAQ